MQARAGELGLQSIEGRIEGRGGNRLVPAGIKAQKFGRGHHIIGSWASASYTDLVSRGIFQTLEEAEGRRCSPWMEPWQELVISSSSWAGHAAISWAGGRWETSRLFEHLA